LDDERGVLLCFKTLNGQHKNAARMCNAIAKLNIRSCCKCFKSIVKYPTKILNMDNNATASKAIIIIFSSLQFSI
jgi:hypothetical protein